MSFLDFVGYDVLLKVLKDVLCIAAGIGLHFFIQRLVTHSQYDDKDNKKEK